MRAAVLFGVFACLAGLHGSTTGHAASAFPRGPEPLEIGSGFLPAVHIGPWASSPAEPSHGHPVVVVLHGNFDRPEWECGAWNDIVLGRGWLLCPRGVSRKDAPGLDRWTFPSRKRMVAELAAGLDALRLRYGAAVADTPPVYVGFSLGAIIGSKIVHAEPARFPRVFLVEGGAAFWTPPRAREFVKGGGDAVYFGCGRAGCDKGARRAAKVLRAAGARAEVVTVAKLGHDYGPPFPKHAKPYFDRLVASTW